MLTRRVHVLSCEQDVRLRLAAFAVGAWRACDRSSRFQKSHVQNTRSGNYVTNYYYMKNMYKATANIESLRMCKSERRSVERIEWRVCDKQTQQQPMNTENE